VVYPWSIHEDVMELLEKIIAKGGKWMSLHDLKTAMKEEFDIYVPYHLLNEVLENMAFHGKIKSKKEGEEELWLLR